MTKCTHEIRRGSLEVSTLLYPRGPRQCGGELDLVGSMSVDTREGFVVHEGEPTPSEGQRWAVYLCPHYHETRVLTDGWPP